jgi:hypothetical protein
MHRAATNRDNLETVILIFGEFIQGIRNNSGEQRLSGMWITSGWRVIRPVSGNNLVGRAERFLKI